jgi:acyl-CoA thioesterase FadM
MTDPRHAPFRAYRTPVREEWIDYNGHMNDACYAIVCTEASEVFLTALGIGDGYHAETGCTTYTVESHIYYRKEATRGDTLHAETSLAHADTKRVRIHHTIRSSTGAEIATAELLYLHVNQHSARVEPFPADRQSLLAEVLTAHSQAVSNVPAGCVQHSSTPCPTFEVTPEDQNAAAAD